MSGKRVAIGVFILAAAGGALWYFRGMKRTPENRLMVSGNIELNEVNIAFKTAGRLVERTVDEGDAVKKGQVIARLDRDQLPGAARARGGRTGIERSATGAGADRGGVPAGGAGGGSGDAPRRRSRVRKRGWRSCRTARGRRKNWMPRRRWTRRQAKLERARRDWERAQTLYKNDDISTAQYDQYRNRFESAQAVLKQAREREALVLAGPRVEQIDAQVGQVARAQRRVKMAEANALELKRREQEIATRRAEIARSQGQPRADRLAARRYRGDVAGGWRGAGEGGGRRAKCWRPGTTVVTVGDIDHPWLRGYINETDLAKVKLGSKARVTTDSYPGKVYNGRVTFISSQAEFTPKQIQTQQERVKLVYRIKIEVENPGRELKSNMPADAEIVLEP